MDQSISRNVISSLLRFFPFLWTCGSNATAYGPDETLSLSYFPFLSFVDFMMVIRHFSFPCPPLWLYF